MLVKVANVKHTKSVILYNGYNTACPRTKLFQLSFIIKNTVIYSWIKTELGIIGNAKLAKDPP